LARYGTILFLLLTITCCTGRAKAQSISRYNTFSYNVNEGLLQSTISDMAFDKNNFCWLSFPNGIQKFDGKSFTTVPVQPGLPDDKLVYFLRCRNGELLISHSQGISKYEINNNRISQVYISHIAGKNPAQFIGEDEGLIYFYSSNGTITGIDGRSYKTVSETKTGFPDYSSEGNYQPKISDNIIQHRVALNINFTLYLWDLKNGKLVSRSAPLSDISFFFLKLKNENEVLYNDYKVNNALKVYNFISHTNSQLVVNGKDDSPIGRCSVFPWQNKILLSFNHRLYETDSTLQILKSELVNFQNQPVAVSQGIAQLKEDNFGNLYLQTVSGGIKKVIKNNYPFKYYSTGKPDSNFVVSILPDKTSNRILAGTAGNGLLIFDTLQHLIKHIKTLPAQKVPATVNSIIKTPKGSYLLFVAGEKNLWELNKDLTHLHSIPISTSLPDNKRGIGYFANVLFQNEQEAVIQSQNKLFRSNFSTNTTTEHLITEGYIMSGLLFNSSIITHTNDELIFLDVASFKELKRIPFKNTGNVRCFTKDGKNKIYVGSNKGIFIIDSTGKILQQLNKKNGLPDECIYAMTFDEAGFLWCSTNKGILTINAGNSFHQFKKEDGLQENEFNTNAVATFKQGEIFFGGVNGISSFYPSAIKSFEENISLLITQIKINNEAAFMDTAAWNISTIELPYHKNLLSFDFIAMANSNPDQYIYQYKMEGIDKEWIQNNDLQTVRYFLPPGHYVFQVYASRYFNKDAQPMQQIKIVIHPPFWKTWWFIILVAMALISVLAYIINLNNKRKYAEKLRQLENERLLKLERERISKDLHDSLGAYANAVLYNIELLEGEKKEDKRMSLMGDLKFVSKDIITSLRETVWALKKESYSAEDCLIRIRNFIQPLTRYYQNIHFKVECDAPPNMYFHYTKALNLVRIVQEAVSNGIKHANPHNITVSCSQQENGWKIVVADDGNGFDTKALNESDPGNGLSNMRHRAKESEFDFSIDTQTASGTIITIIV